MRLNLHKSIFHEKYHVELNQILAEGYRKRISVHIEDVKSFECWVKNRPKLEQEKWDLLIRASAKLHLSANTTCIFQIINDVEFSDWDATPPQARTCDVDMLVNMPTTVVLENSRNDKNFLLSLCKPSLRERLIELEAQERLVFDGPGGINELINNMNGKYVSHPAKRFKYWLLFDGDATIPDEIAETAKKLIALCKANKFNNFHCLSRRAIENYLPISKDTDIEQLYSLFNVENTEFKEQLICFSHLTENQRYYYHMKEGLKKSNCKNSGLYDDFDKNTKKIIGRGFKVRIDSLFYCGNNPKSEDFEPVYRLHEKEGTPDEMLEYLKQLDFNTRKMQ